MAISTNGMAILIGGLLPAVLLGVTGIFQKFSTKAGIATGPFLIAVGITTVVVGAVFIAMERDAQVNTRSAVMACLFAAFWAVGTGCITIALRRYNGQISQLVPLYNMNTLIAVLIGVIALSEWHQVNPTKLLLATVFIIIGGILASTA